jgi:acylphosphatase
MNAIEAIVKGRVQMVMFRDFTQRKARGLGIVGEVENLPDGTVRVRAEGERESLEKLVAHLKRGSLLSKVEDVKAEWKEPTGMYTKFLIRYT